MTHCVRKSIYDSPLNYFQNVHQIPIFLQIMETMKMIKITKIIQTIKMKVIKQQINICSNTTVEKKFWCLHGYLWTYFTPCSSVFDVDFKHVIVHYFFSHYKHQRIMSYMHKKSSYSSSKFVKECLLYFTLKVILLTLNILDFFSEV